jgi:HK97 family phage major capsid protein
MSEEIKAVEMAVEGFQKKLDGALGDMQQEIKESGKVSVETTRKLDELSAKWAESEAKLADLEQKSVAAVQAKNETKSMGAQFVGSAEFKGLQPGGVASLETKNTISQLVGSPADAGDTLAQFTRLPGVVPGAFRRLTVLDVIPVATVDGPAVEFTREAAYTSNAAETQESGSKPESDLTFELITNTVRTIAVTLPATEQALADASWLRSYIDRRLTHALRQRLELQILRGNGTAPNIKGIDQSGNNTAFTPATGDTRFDSVNKAKYLVVGDDFMATHVFMSPADFGTMERTKTGVSGDNSYLAGGDAALSYINNGMTPLLWGLPVIVSNNVAAGKFYCLDINAVELAVRQGIRVQTGYVSEQFKKNEITIRAEMRGAFSVFQPKAIRFGDLVLA